MLYFSDDWKKVEFNLYGEKIKAEVKPLTCDQMIAISPYFKFSGSQTEKSAEELLFGLQKAALPFVGEFIRNVENIMVNDKPLQIEQLATEAFLAPLLTALVSKAFGCALVDKESEKNLL